MKIKELNPDDETQINAMSVLERSAFELSGNDPTEFPEVIKYIGREGKVFVGYETVKKENIPADLADVICIKEAVAEIPVAFIELIALDNSLSFYSRNKYNESLTDSPFMVSKSSTDRIYNFARKYARGDCTIIDHHGVGVHKDFQNSGRGSVLLEHALSSEFTKGKLIVCNIDIAKRNDENVLQDIFNDRSFAAHLNRGFITGDILEPPVYEGTIFYASTLRIPNIGFSGRKKEFDVGRLRQDPKNLVDEMKELHAMGFVGVGYNSKTRIMYFDRIK